MPVCRRCGARSGVLGILTTDLTSGDYTCPACEQAKLAEQQKEQRDRALEVRRLKKIAETVIVTTTPKVDGYYAASYLGIESVEFVIGTGIFSEISGEVSDFFGARSTAFETKLQTAKQTAMDTLKFRRREGCQCCHRG